MKRKLEKAFTLIELMVVVGVIGILITIVGANYINAMQRADAAACQENLRTVFTALQAYRIDYNRFPPADGIADNEAHPDKTEYGCGPAANGFWSGVSYLLVKYNYCMEDCLYCPALKRRYQKTIDAYPGCGETFYAGKQVPQWKFFRFAYNSAAADAGGSSGGENDLERSGDNDVWMLRCLHLDIGQFNEERAVPFPFEVKKDEENPNLTWWGEYEMTLHGTIRLRPVQLRK